jgi:hypothetical protein
MSVLASLTIASVLAGSPACTPAPHYQSGRQIATVCLESLPSGITVIDLADDWVPRLFSETAAHPQSYRSVFVGLANEQFGQDSKWDAARRDRHGCHRLFNHLAVRLGSFLLRHSMHVRHGSIAEVYIRPIRWKGHALVLRAEDRGYRYELVPPVPVDVLPGRTVRTRAPKTTPPAKEPGTPIARSIPHGN